jgi:hypothetical protein
VGRASPRDVCGNGQAEMDKLNGQAGRTKTMRSLHRVNLMKFSPDLMMRSLHKVNFIEV